ncbi:DUF2249 domain-containing protein [Thalassotalea sp. ND16A]|uniref:DUF2249 domain-containing protein n=1 Tax=Thalassotalea sp. ND16A TaxID=1535422 RepID=UPI00051A0BAE|nr:DUF2249 domain-containing protein [Thalassotalea sp. ND16A]KGJ98511.1 hypothetical protein ND16A_0581 [Thalassotalea sp. ND16A]
MQQVDLNVSELEPPEPMTKVLTALAQLQPWQYLKVFHRREPFPLYEKLAQAGWAYQCQRIKENQFNIYIYRQTDHDKFRQQLSQHLNQKYSDL